MRTKNKLGRRITLVITISLWVMVAIFSILFYFIFRTVYLNFYNDRAKDIVNIVADRVDWEKIEKYTETGVEDYYSMQLKELFDSTINSCPEITYLYMFLPRDTYFIYVYDAIREGDSGREVNVFGDTYDYGPDEYERLVPDIDAAQASSDINIMNGDLGVYLEVWTPVFDDHGKLKAMIEADYLVENINKDSNTVLISIIVFFALFTGIEIIVVNAYLRRNLIVPLSILRDGVDSYEHGQMTLNKESFKREDELKHLALSFEEMTERIETYNNEVQRISAEKERISTELSIATQIQAGMLPNIFPNFVGKDEYELYALMNPAKEVGGDFFDFFNVDDDHLALVIADVSGKGVPAALFMMMSMMLIKSRTQQGGTPAEILEYVNNKLCESNPNEMFVTVWLGIVTLSTGDIVAASAGHEFPVLTDSEGKYVLFKDPHGFVCGAMEGMTYENYDMKLEKGGKLFVYTDGVPEAHNIKDELFEFDRIEEILNANKDANPEETIKSVRKAIDEFAGEKEQFDDITMLSFLYKGKN